MSAGDKLLRVGELDRCIKNLRVVSGSRKAKATREFRRRPGSIGRDANAGFA